MKKVIQVLLLGFILMISLVGCANENASTNTKKLSDIENDAYIIYNLSYTEATQLNGVSSKTINITKATNQTTYKFLDLLLSCGTLMNGEILEDVKDNIKTTTGSFNVSKNPYGITNLKINTTLDIQTGKKTGYLEIDGKQVDINSKFTPI